MRAGLIIVFVVLTAFCCLLYFRLGLTHEAATSAPAPKTFAPLSDPPTATAVLTRCADTYRSLNAYSDTFDLLVSVESQPPFENKFLGSTEFAKSNGLQFILDKESGENYYKLRTGANGQNHGGKWNPVAAIILIIPQLLEKDYNDASELGLSDLELLEGFEQAASRNYTIRANATYGGVVTLIISKDSFLLLRAERLLLEAGAGLKTLEVAEFHPRNY
ncbi:MAG: hypothetical protein ACKVS6_04245 [Planctomycetota bacterium]